MTLAEKTACLNEISDRLEEVAELLDALVNPPAAPRHLWLVDAQGAPLIRVVQ